MSSVFILGAGFCLDANRHEQTKAALLVAHIHLHAKWQHASVAGTIYLMVLRKRFWQPGISATENPVTYSLI